MLGLPGFARRDAFDVPAGRADFEVLAGLPEGFLTADGFGPFLAPAAFDRRVGIVDSSFAAVEVPDRRPPAGRYLRSPPPNSPESRIEPRCRAPLGDRGAAHGAAIASCSRVPVFRSGGVGRAAWTATRTRW